MQGARPSPLAGAGRIRTPLLLYHGESDLRVPIGQSEALLAAIPVVICLRGGILERPLRIGETRQGFGPRELQPIRSASLQIGCAAV